MRGIRRLGTLGWALSYGRKGIKDMILHGTEPGTWDWDVI